VGGVDELVTALLVLGPGVVLHELADHPPLGVEDGQATTDLGWEVEQVQLEPQLAVITSLRLLQPVQVVGQGLLRLPRRAVDPLELGLALVAPPVGAGHPHELERSQPAGGRDVGAAAEVDELGAVAVGADGGGAGTLRRIGALDYLHLVGLLGEEGEPLVPGHLLAQEGLVLGHDPAHAVLDPL